MAMAMLKTRWLPCGRLIAGWSASVSRATCFNRSMALSRIAAFFRRVCRLKGRIASRNPMPDCRCRPQHDIFHYVEAFKKYIALEHPPNSPPGPLVGRPTGNILTGEQNASLGYTQRTINHIQGGRFTSAVGADQPQDLPVCNAEAQIVDRIQSAEGLADILKFQDVQKWFPFCL